MLCFRSLVAYHVKVPSMPKWGVRTAAGYPAPTVNLQLTSLQIHQNTFKQFPSVVRITRLLRTIHVSIASHNSWSLECPKQLGCGILKFISPPVVGFVCHLVHIYIYIHIDRYTYWIGLWKNICTCTDCLFCTACLFFISPLRRLIFFSSGFAIHHHSNSRVGPTAVSRELKRPWQKIMCVYIYIYAQYIYIHTIFGCTIAKLHLATSFHNSEEAQQGYLHVYI